MTVRGVYIAYPIDQAHPSEDTIQLYSAIEWFEHGLLANGAADWIYDPGDAFNVSRDAKPTGGVAAVNGSALSEADAVVAFLPREVASIGVPMEVERALALGKVVIVLSDAKSWMLESGVTRRYNGWSVQEMGDAIDFLKAVDLEAEPPEARAPMFVVADQGRVPTRAYDDDAGWDLFVDVDCAIAPGAFFDVPCGARAAVPPWAWGLLTGRSSALRRHGLLVHTGVIDAGYRGPLYAGCFNLTDQVVELKAGDRVAQLIIVPNGTASTEVVKVDALPEGARGDNGFGSSGR